MKYGCLAIGPRGSAVYKIIEPYALQKAGTVFSSQEIQYNLDYLLNFKQQMRICCQTENISQWVCSMEHCIRNQVDLSEEEIREAITVLLHYYTTLDSSKYRKLYIAYLSYITD